MVQQDARRSGALERATMAFANLKSDALPPAEHFAAAFVAAVPNA